MVFLVKLSLDKLTVSAMEVCVNLTDFHIRIFGASGIFHIVCHNRLYRETHILCKYAYHNNPHEKTCKDYCVLN